MSISAHPKRNTSTFSVCERACTSVSVCLSVCLSHSHSLTLLNQLGAGTAGRCDNSSRNSIREPCRPTHRATQEEQRQALMNRPSPSPQLFSRLAAAHTRTPYPLPPFPSPLLLTNNAPLNTARLGILARSKSMSGVPSKSAMRNEYEPKTKRSRESVCVCVFMCGFHLGKYLWPAVTTKRAYAQYLANQP